MISIIHWVGPWISMQPLPHALTAKSGNGVLPTRAQSIGASSFLGLRSGSGERVTRLHGRTGTYTGPFHTRRRADPAYVAGTGSSPGSKW